MHTAREREQRRRNPFPSLSQPESAERPGGVAAPLGREPILSPMPLPLPFVHPTTASQSISWPRNRRYFGMPGLRPTGLLSYFALPTILARRSRFHFETRHRFSRCPLLYVGNKRRRKLVWTVEKSAALPETLSSSFPAYAFLQSVLLGQIDFWNTPLSSHSRIDPSEFSQKAINSHRTVARYVYPNYSSDVTSTATRRKCSLIDDCGSNVRRDNCVTLRYIGIVHHGETRMEYRDIIEKIKIEILWSVNL